MTNQTIDGVPRELLENAARCIERYQFGTDWARKLRALLDAPKCEMCDGSGRLGMGLCECFDKPATQSQGEPVEPFGYWLQPKGLPLHGMFHRVTENDKVIYEPSNTLERFDAIALYAWQPAPVAVVLPERLNHTDGLHTYEYVTGHNAAIDKMLGVKS